ncbi:MAG: type I methionyl aminopeptidase [Candidatus Omnitrophica bacterium]|nr:type I methionyl aminopeptidase [Candidatus Omnitrophota bacterium]
MIYLKSTDEIELMKKAGEIAVEAMEQVKKFIKPGVKTKELDFIAEKIVKEAGADSAFKKVDNYKYTICVTPNDWVVHGLPGDYVLQEGDILGIDLGTLYKGYNSDLAHTFPVGEISKDKRVFLDTGRQALKKALNQLVAGRHIGDISYAIQQTIEGAGYSVVRELVGHGIGKNLHEEPFIPGRGERNKGLVLQVGMVLAVEVIYTAGSHKVKLLEDGWTIVSRDGSLAGLFERTIAITERGPKLLTNMPI